MVALIQGAARQSEGVAAGTRLGQRIGADQILGQPRKVFTLLLSAPPSHERVIDQRVLDVDENAKRCVHPRKLLDGKNRHEKAARRAAEFFGDVDSH